MSTSTIVNGQTVVHKDSDGILTTSPDVCLTPMGSTVVPIPYVNVARSLDTSNGSRTMTVDGNPIMLKDSVFSTSCGDEPGTAGGVVSGVNRGKAKFVNFSNNVFVEGRPVCRRLDPMISNLSSPGNTPPAPLMQPNAAASELDAAAHVLPITFVFLHPDVTAGRVRQPLLSTPHTAIGPETFRHEEDKYVGVLHRCMQEGEYELEFDSFDLEEKPLSEEDEII
jgi:hypothetical protein